MCIYGYNDAIVIIPISIEKARASPFDSDPGGSSLMVWCSGRTVVVLRGYNTIYILWCSGSMLC